jgi:hypothetical protein
MRLSGDEIKTAFRLHVATSVRRCECPSVEEIGDTFLPNTEESTRLRVIDHLSRCLACAREFEAARLLHAGHERIAPMLPDRFEDSEIASGRVVPFRGRPRSEGMRLVWRPTFALAAAAGLVVVFAVGALLSQVSGLRGERLVAVAPVDRAGSADLRLVWQGIAGAASYDVTMSWPSGTVFYESGPLAATSLTVPEGAVERMKRGQTCLWTVRALDSEGRELTRETFSFVVDFDPAG